MTWLFFSLLTAIFWGIGQVFIKKGVANLSPLWMLVINTAVNLCVYLSFSLLHGFDFRIEPIYLLLIPVVTFLYAFFFYAIEKGKLAFTGTIFATYPFTTIILSFIFLNERPSPIQILMMLLILAGGILLTQTDKTTKKKKTKNTWLAWAIFGSITTGLGDFLVKIILNNTPVQTYNFYFPLAYVLILLCFWLVDKKGRALRQKISTPQLSISLIGIVMLAFGMLSFNFALALGQASFVTTISSSYAALTLVLSFVFLKESVTRKQFFALSMIVVGIIFLGFKAI